MQEYLKKYFENVYTIRQTEKKIGLIRQAKIFAKRILNGSYSAQERRKENFKGRSSGKNKIKIYEKREKVWIGKIN